MMTSLLSIHVQLYHINNNWHINDPAALWYTIKSQTKTLWT